MISPSQSRYLTQTSMPRVRFEPTIPALERVKTVHALDRAATVIGNIEILKTKLTSVVLVRKRTIPNERPPLSAK
jgi:hypothetical protein